MHGMFVVGAVLRLRRLAPCCIFFLNFLIFFVFLFLSPWIFPSFFFPPRNGGRGWTVAYLLCNACRLVRRAWQTLWKPVPELINILGVDVPDPPDVSLAGIRSDAATVNWTRPPANRSVQKFLIQVNGVVGEWKPSTMRRGRRGLTSSSGGSRRKPRTRHRRQWLEARPLLQRACDCRRLQQFPGRQPGYPVEDVWPRWETATRKFSTALELHPRGTARVGAE